MAQVELVGRTDFLQPKSVPFASEIDGAEALAEFGGRACYQSWDKPNPKTATNKGYLANIQRQKHLSVLEHTQATFYITEIPRSLTHEFIRHRHFSYSELSQRYVNVEDYDVIPPPDLAGYEGTELWERADALVADADALYSDLALDMEARGYSRKEARQAARFILPEGKETRILVTGNFRSWLEFLEKRDNPAADKAIQEVARMIHEILKQEFPNVFDNEEI